MYDETIYEGYPAWVDFSPLILMTAGLLLLSCGNGNFLWFALIAAAVTLSKRYGYHGTVTSSRIITRVGIGSTKTYEIDIKDIRSINVSQTIFQKLFNTGDLEFTTASGVVKEVVICGVVGPTPLKEKIRMLKNQEAAPVENPSF